MSARSGFLLLVLALWGCGGVSREGTDGPEASLHGSGILPSRPLVDLASPAPRLPENGRATGSVWAARARTPHLGWAPVPGAETYDLELDDECDSADPGACSFASPVWTAADLERVDVVIPDVLPLSYEPPVGARVYWRVRACRSDGCSAWSPARYLDVGRQRGDLDGDGYADLVVPIGPRGTTPGRFDVRFGPELSDVVSLSSESLGAESGNQFGTASEVLGDVDGDGFADLVLTIPGDRGDDGSAFLVFGGTDFRAGSGRAERLEGDPEGGALGEVVRAAGDVNGDGLQDFLLSYYEYGTDQSPAVLYLGAPGGAPLSPLPVGAPLPQSIDVLTSAGDVTGDGYTDVLVTRAWRDYSYSTDYELWSGGPTGLSAAVSLGREEGYPRGTVEVAGDVNDDGFADIVHYSDDQDAQAEVSLGSDPPRLAPALTWGVQSTSEPYVYSPRVSRAKVAGDVDGDGVDDSVVGLRWDYSSVAAVNLYLGGRGSREAPDAAYELPGASLRYVSEGLPYAPGDVNGDGYDDVVLGDWHWGALVVFHGGPELDTVPDCTLGFK